MAKATHTTDTKAEQLAAESKEWLLKEDETPQTILNSLGWQVHAVEHSDIRGKKTKYLKLTKNAEEHIMRIGDETYNKVNEMNK